VPLFFIGDQNRQNDSEGDDLDLDRNNLPIGLDLKKLYEAHQSLKKKYRLLKQENETLKYKINLITNDRNHFKKLAESKSGNNF
jgi:FMN phosphatase YigB (HAD superfamily)